MEGCLYIVRGGGRKNSGRRRRRRRVGGDDEGDGEEGEGYNTHNARGVIRSGHHE